MAPTKLVLATRMDFWRLGAGARVRVLALVSYLGRITQLTVVYLGPVSAADVQQTGRLGVRCEMVALDPRFPLTDAEYTRRFAALCAARRFDVCIIDRIGLSFLLDAVPPDTKTLLDTHDIVSDLGASMRKFGAAAEPGLDAAAEFAMFRRYDAVIAIQQYDYDLICAQLGGARTVLAPHPALSSRRELRPVVSSIGFVASGWKANVDGIAWFASDVWPLVRRPGIALDLFGWIAERWKPPQGEAIVAHGFRPDLDAVYRSIDIVINPVRYGAGLKIKTAEALGNGLPLVTSSEGARGLHAIAGTAFLVADSPADFAAHLNRLIDDHDARKALGEAAYRFAEAHLSPQACFGALAREIHRPKLPGDRGRQEHPAEPGRI